jgi:hypothetical protein
MTMTAIKHCAQQQKNSSENPMGRESQQQQFWLSSCTLAKATNKAQKYSFTNLIDFYVTLETMSN